MPTAPQVDCYAVLGIPPNAKDEIVRAAYKVMVGRYQRGRLAGTPDEVQRRMAEAERAYEILVDPVRRRRYDLHRHIEESTGRLSGNRSVLSVRAANAAIGAGWHRPRLMWTIFLFAFALAALVIYFFSAPGEEHAAAGRSAGDRSGAVPALRTASGPPAPLPRQDGERAVAPPPRAAVVAPPPSEVAATPAPASAFASAALETVAATPAPSAPPRRAQPSPRGVAATRAEPRASTCTDVVIALGLCQPDSTRKEP